MKRSTQITTATHSLFCNQSYIELLKSEVSSSDYIACINSHTELTNDRLYRSFMANKISYDEFNESKSIVTKVHNAYLRKGTIYA